jgi:hypothetical protein
MVQDLSGIAEAIMALAYEQRTASLVALYVADSGYNGHSQRRTEIAERLGAEFTNPLKTDLDDLNVDPFEKNDPQIGADEEYRSYVRKPRLKACVENWPECLESEYHPNCCRFPKSCSCKSYPDDIDPKHLEGN